MPLSLDPDRARPEKRLGGFIGLFDMPLHRDWLAWWTAFWSVTGVLSVVFPTATSRPPTELPVWANAVLSFVVLGSIMGLLPAYLRVIIRRRMILRQRGRQTSALDSRSASHSSRARARPDDLDRIQAAQAQALQPERSGAPTAESAELGVQSDRTGSAPVRTSPRVRTERSAPDLDMDRTLTTASASLPYPVARAARKVQLAAEPKEMYEAALRAGEALSTVLGLTAVAWAVHHGSRTPSIDRLVSALLQQGVAQGTWLEAAQSVEKSMNGENGLPGFALAMRRTRGQPGLHNDLKTITAERNAWAHGASPRSQADASSRLADILPPLLRSLALASGLTEHAWVLVTDAVFDRHTRHFNLSGARAMGAHPDWDRVHLISGEPVAQDSLYLTAPGGLIDLTPFCVLRTCPRCNQPEVAFADKLDPKKGVSLKSFDTGHPFYDVPLAKDVKALAGPEQQNGPGYEQG